MVDRTAAAMLVIEKSASKEFGYIIKSVGLPGDAWPVPFDGSLEDCFDYISNYYQQMKDLGLLPGTDGVVSDSAVR